MPSEDFIPGGTGTTQTAESASTDIFEKISKGLSIAERFKSLFDDGNNSDKASNMRGTSSEILSRQPINLQEGQNLEGLFSILGNVFKGGDKPIALAPAQTSKKVSTVSSFFSPLVLVGIATVSVVLIVAVARR